jgi:hypothetical protein
VVAARSIYLDASALVKLVVTEAESAALRGYLAAELPRVTSRIAEVEVTRALRRVAQPGDEEQANAVLGGMRFLEVDAPTSAAACSVGPPTLRSLDAIHLASALTLASELEALVTYDARLADAARAAGLTVVAPA